MRPDHPAKGQSRIRAVTQSGGNAICAADDKGQILTPVIAPSGQLSGKFGAGHHKPAFIQRHQGCTLRQAAGQKGGFRRHAAAFAIFNLVFGQRTKAKRARGAVEAGQIIIKQRAFGVYGAHPAHGTDVQLHSSARTPIWPPGCHIFSSW